MSLSVPLKPTLKKILIRNWQSNFAKTYPVKILYEKFFVRYSLQNLQFFLGEIAEGFWQKNLTKSNKNTWQFLSKILCKILQFLPCKIWHFYLAIFGVFTLRFLRFLLCGFVIYTWRFWRFYLTVLPFLLYNACNLYSQGNISSCTSGNLNHDS